MQSRGTLLTLVDLAQRRADEAVRALGDALGMADAAKEKLTLLAQYRDDYANRLQASLMRGLSLLDYQNYCSFLDQLDGAASRQEKAVRDAEQHVELRRFAWHDAIRKRDSFLTLVARRDAEQEKIESKRDQRLTDEYAVRSVHARGKPSKQRTAS
jgi:flagellar FliJ protein